MTRRLMTYVALVAVLATPAYVGGHEGHIHKILGTVSTHHDNHLEVKATDGTTSIITVNDKTKILRGKAKATADDIKTGERIVVTAREGKEKAGRAELIATEIRLAAAQPK